MSKYLLTVFTCLCLGLLELGCRTAATPTVGSISRNDARMDELVPRSARLEKLASGFKWSEGPVWVEDSSYVLFSDIPRNTIFKWKEGEGLSVYMRPAGYAGANPHGPSVGTNGLVLGPDGAVVATDQGNRAIVRISDSLFTKEFMATSYQGKRFNSPNDAVYDSKGNLYFTDPPYGLPGLNNNPLKELPHNGVYLLAPDGTVKLLTAEMTFPNGIALSPDEKTLYVANSDRTRPVIMAFTVKSDGTIENGRVLFDALPLFQQGKIGNPDGMKIDERGNIFTTGPGGVLVITPDGTHLGTIETGKATANVAFGGEDFSTLYITASNDLLRIPLNTRGLKLLD